jgi:hypothetical protein
MPTKTVTEHVRAELLRDGKTAYTPRLRLTVNEFTLDPSSPSVKRIIDRHELAPMSGMVIEDGEYTLRYSFDGNPQESNVRVRDGRLYVAPRKK